MGPEYGVMLNGNLIDYKITTILDCGPIDAIIVETAMGYGPYGANGIGEDVADHCAFASRTGRPQRYRRGGRRFSHHPRQGPQGPGKDIARRNGMKMKAAI